MSSLLRSLSRQQNPLAVYSTLDPNGLKPEGSWGLLCSYQRQKWQFLNSGFILFGLLCIFPRSMLFKNYGSCIL